MESISALKNKLECVLFLPVKPQLFVLLVSFLWLGAERILAETVTYVVNRGSRTAVQVMWWQIHSSFHYTMTRMPIPAKTLNSISGRWLCFFPSFWLPFPLSPYNCLPAAIASHPDLSKSRFSLINISLLLPTGGLRDLRMLGPLFPHCPPDGQFKYVYRFALNTTFLKVKLPPFFLLLFILFLR